MKTIREIASEQRRLLAELTGDQTPRDLWHQVQMVKRDLEDWEKVANSKLKSAKTSAKR